MPDLPFEKLSAETRDDYRENPATQSLIVTLLDTRRVILDGVADSLRCGGMITPEKQGRFGGQLDIIEQIIAMVNRG